MEARRLVRRDRIRFIRANAKYLGLIVVGAVISGVFIIPLERTPFLRGLFLGIWFVGLVGFLGFPRMAFAHDRKSVAPQAANPIVAVMDVRLTKDKSGRSAPEPGRAQLQLHSRRLLACCWYSSSR